MNPLLVIHTLLSTVTRAIPGYPRSRRSLPGPVVVLGELLYYTVLTVGVLLMLAPIIIVVTIAFSPTTSETFPPDGFSLRWFHAFFQSDQFVHAFFYVSLPIAIIAGAIATVLGLLAAYVLVRRDLPFDNAAQMTLLAPMIIPSVIIGLSLMLFFSGLDFNWSYANLILGHAVKGIPYAVLTTMTSLYKVNSDLELAARNLGASSSEAFRKVTLPLIRSGVIAGFMLAFITSFADINISLFLSSGTSTTLPLAIFTFLRWESSPIVAATATMQILVILVMVILIGRLVGFRAVID